MFRVGWWRFSHEKKTCLGLRLDGKMNHLLLSWRLGVNQLNSDFVQLEDEIPVLSSMQDNRSP